MKRWQQFAFASIIFAAMVSAADEPKKNVLLKKSKKYDANEGDVRLVGGTDTFEGK